MKVAITCYATCITTCSHVTKDLEVKKRAVRQLRMQSTYQYPTTEHLPCTSDQSLPSNILGQTDRQTDRMTIQEKFETHHALRRNQRLIFIASNVRPQGLHQAVVMVYNESSNSKTVDRQINRLRLLSQKVKDTATNYKMSLACLECIRMMI